MNKLLLDAGPLSALCHPRLSLEISQWVRRQLAKQAEVYIPEVADYEVRRELLRMQSQSSIERLDNLKKILEYLPITTPVMQRAASLWAEARRKGLPTADPKSLDADVIIASQAQAIGAVVITENRKHFEQFVEARSFADEP